MKYAKGKHPNSLANLKNSANKGKTYKTKDIRLRMFRAALGSSEQWDKTDDDLWRKIALAAPAGDLRRLVIAVQKGETDDVPMGVWGEIAGWFDPKRGADNLRKSKERAFGRPQEHHDITTAGNPLGDVVDELTREEVESIISTLVNKESTDGE